eukprot:2707156-Prymnesium_polylepis.1
MAMPREPALEGGECPLARRRPQVRRVTHTHFITVEYWDAGLSPPATGRGTFSRPHVGRDPPVRGAGRNPGGRAIGP